jgi:hypothetical protein
LTVPRAVALAAIVIVAGVLFAAFTVLGSPGKARLRGFDRLRIDDLIDIANELHEAYDGSHAGLPLELPGSQRDPVSGKPYEYRRLDSRHYLLCATFDLFSPDRDEATLERGIAWGHAAGRSCYRLDGQHHYYAVVPY